MEVSPYYVQYLTGKNAWDTAMDRMRWIFKEFDGNVTVSTSGGKDSTVTLELAVMAARELGYLPVRAMWLDQECEYESTVSYHRYLMDRDDVDLQWYQIPFKLFNATDHATPWLNVWGEGEDWVRPKEPDSIHENTMGTTRFGETLEAINKVYPGVSLTGMRVEESPGRRSNLLSHPTYKWVTWSNGKLANNNLKMHPVYDWTYQDVWKAIDEHGWRYNTYYDQQYRFGVPILDMRVSNYHHETALTHLGYLQEIEPETWEAATRRLSTVQTYAHMPVEQIPDQLPYMFTSWEEYMYYLIDNLVEVESERATYRKKFLEAKKVESPTKPGSAARIIARAAVINDSFCTSVNSWIRVQPATTFLNHDRRKLV